MPHRAPFAAALIAGTSYYFNDALTTDGTLAHMVWKGSGVGLLALWAALTATDRDGWLLAAVLVLGAVGDMLLDAMGLEAGAVAFLAGHAVAVSLYLRNRGAAVPADYVVACVILVATPVAAAALPADRAAVGGIALYALGLGAMAATAWLSRFGAGVRAGALLFVASDLLIFASGGPLAGSRLPDLLIWPLYFAGQALIAHGVAATLRRAG